ncbi:MAG TPA: hypothetical protein VGI46_07780 [Candidatus Acidoferrum sp.]|jgi:hypothetical protein
MNRMGSNKVKLMPITDDQRRDPERGLGRTIGHLCAALSLLCCLSFWLQMTLYFTTKVILIDFNGFQWFKFMGVAVVLAIVAVALGSKLWRVALPVSLLMFFFTNYVMGT